MGEVREYWDSILTVSEESQDSKSGRYWEIDAIRGIAILGMLFYHLLTCLVLFHIIVEDPNFLSYYNTYMFGSGVFVLLAGIAMILRHERMRGRTTKEYYLDLGFCITIGSWIGASLFLGSDAFIKFGFLHMLGVSMLLATPLLRYGKWNIILGMIIIAIGAFISPTSMIRPGSIHRGFMRRISCSIHRIISRCSPGLACFFWESVSAVLSIQTADGILPSASRIKSGRLLPNSGTGR